MSKPIESSELILLYQDQLDNIHDLKDKAWKVTHYSVLGQGAVIALSEVVNRLNFNEKLELTGLSLAVFAWAVGLVHHLQGRIIGRRKALGYLRMLRGCEDFKESFDAVWKETREMKRPPKPWWSYPKRWNGDRAISFAYAMALLTPAVVVTVFIWSR